MRKKSGELQKCNWKENYRSELPGYTWDRRDYAEATQSLSRGPESVIIAISDVRNINIMYSEAVKRSDGGGDPVSFAYRFCGVCESENTAWRTYIDYAK